MAERTCIVTREVHDPDALIRFVADPSGAVVPDLKRNLPGRGVWVGASRERVDEAVNRRLFARGLKAQVTASTDLGQTVDDLLRHSALGALGFARKAGECVTGAGKVDDLIRKNRAIAVLHAREAADDGVRKLAQAARATSALGGKDVPLIGIFSAGELEISLGGHNVIHAALKDGGAARNCLQRIRKLLAYRGEDEGLDGSAEARSAVAAGVQTAAAGLQNWTPAPKRAKDTPNALPDAGKGRKDRNS